EEQLVADLHRIARESNWRPALFTDLLDTYTVTQEMLLQRLTNLLPHHFGIEDLFFIRLQATEHLKSFHMTKELHLAQLHSPYNNELLEHYCRRWVSTGILRQLAEQFTNKPAPLELADAQISEYWGTEKAYFCLSMAKGQDNRSASVTLGLLVTPHLRSVFNFLNDPALTVKIVGTTCERCSLPNCEARVRPPLVLEKAQRKTNLLNELDQL
ncbi:MAG: XRE family transcriptional regulator, partial [Bacteroidota bacterium]